MITDYKYKWCFNVFEYKYFANVFEYIMNTFDYIATEWK